MDQLSGKTAVVTGAASGIGLAMATRFAEAGMSVVLSDIEEPRLAEAAATVEAIGGQSLAVVTDVSDGTSVDALAAAAFDAFGSVSLLCNNAGVSGSSLTTGPGHLDEADWRWVMDVNFWGVLHGHRAFLPHMLERGEGHIVNTSSMAGHLPGHSAYMASKWAVVGITEGLYHQLNATDSGVGVSCLCPSWVNTQIAESHRNRPDWAAPDHANNPAPSTEGVRGVIKGLLANGLDPAHVADVVHDAVVRNDFWIFTHPEDLPQLQNRYDAILEQRNPPPFAGI